MPPRPTPPVRVESSGTFVMADVLASAMSVVVIVEDVYSKMSDEEETVTNDEVLTTPVAVGGVPEYPVIVRPCASTHANPFQYATGPEGYRVVSKRLLDVVAPSEAELAEKTSELLTSGAEFDRVRAALVYSVASVRSDCVDT